LQPVVFGTSGNDNIHVEVVPGGGFNVTLNGKAYSYTRNELSIVGGGSNDTVRVTGTDADEVLTAHPHSFEFGNGNFQVTGEEIEFLTVTGNGGDDHATLFDSSGNERVVARVGNTSVRDLAGTFTHRAFGFGNVLLKSSGALPGNFDMANLFDSAEKDTFVGNSTDAQITSASRNYIVRSEGYDRNVVRSTLGGEDVAILNGTTESNENFTAKVTNDASKNFGILRNGPGAPTTFLNRAIGFSSVQGNSGGGSDKGFFFDGTGNDDYRSTSTQAQLQGTSYHFLANNFSRVTTQANRGGTDTATLIDGTGDDRLTGSTDRATLLGDSSAFVHTTFGFEQVVGNASQGGTDQLSLASDIVFSFFELGTWEIS
jgi:hypothetical protein